MQWALHTFEYLLGLVVRPWRYQLRMRGLGFKNPKEVKLPFITIPGNVENFPILSLIYANGVAGGIGYLLKTPNTGRKPGLRLMV